MKNKKNILFVSSGRADFFILEPLIKIIKENIKEKKISAKVFFVSVGDINFLNNDKKLKNILNYSLNLKFNKLDLSNLFTNFSLSINKFYDLIKKINPTQICLLGDRNEILTPAIVSFFCKIPIFHFHGGEVSKGSTDDYVRKIVSILSDIHLVAHKNAKNILIKFGVPKNKIFVTGSLGIENIISIPKKSISSKIIFNKNKKNILFTYHPVTKLKDYGIDDLKKIIIFLKSQKNTNIFITYPNKDLYSSKIIKILNNLKNVKNFYFYESLGENYISVVRLVDVVIGNSSSGIIEVPSLNKPVINVGLRQDQRFASKAIINSSVNFKDLTKSLKKAYSKKFLSNIKYFKNPYEGKNVYSKVISILLKNFK
jgi:UDP-hydrolysing UDP-N-acetyl-D-glucosamine 2-epimerase